KVGYCGRYVQSPRYASEGRRPGQRIVRAEHRLQASVERGFLPRRACAKCLEAAAIRAVVAASDVDKDVHHRRSRLIAHRQCDLTTTAGVRVPGESRRDRNNVEIGAP